MKIFSPNDPALIENLVKILNAGGVALIPTETVYGLVARADNVQAKEKIYAIKSRETSKLLQLFFANRDEVVRYGAELSPLADHIISQHCPGALMPIVPLKNGGTLGFRIPNHSLVQSLLNALGAPLVATSANRSGEPNALSVHMALSQFELMPDAVVDAGEIPPDALASTIVDFTQSPPKILRQGALQLDF